MGHKALTESTVLEAPFNVQRLPARSKNVEALSSHLRRQMKWQPQATYLILGIHPFGYQDLFLIGFGT